MEDWILIKDRLPNESYTHETLLVAFIGWDDIIFQRTLEYDYQNDEWSDWNGQIYKNETIIAWQQLPSTSDLKL